MRKVNIKIEGMSCSHCVGHVTDALKKIGAQNVDVSLENGCAVAETDKSNEEIKTAIEDEGYDVVSIG